MSLENRNLSRGVIKILTACRMLHPYNDSENPNLENGELHCTTPIFQLFLLLLIASLVAIACLSEKSEVYFKLCLDEVIGRISELHSVKVQ